MGLGVVRRTRSAIGASGRSRYVRLHFDCWVLARDGGCLELIDLASCDGSAGQISGIDGSRGGALLSRAKTPSVSGWRDGRKGLRSATALIFRSAR